MNYGAWGMFWGGSWGNSWGPLHEVYEQPAGSPSNKKKSRVIIGTKEYFLTPLETADLLIQRAKKRKKQKIESVTVIEEKTESVNTVETHKPDKIDVKFSQFDLSASIKASNAFIEKLRAEFYRLEAEEIERRLELDDEECLMLLL